MKQVNTKAKKIKQPKLYTISADAPVNKEQKENEWMFFNLAMKNHTSKGKKGTRYSAVQIGTMKDIKRYGVETSNPFGKKDIKPATKSQVATYNKYVKKWGY